MNAIEKLVRLIPGDYRTFFGSPAITVGKCKISPEVALEIMTHHHRDNRPEIAGNTAYLTGVMEHHHWMFTGETIIFDWDGFMRNGQHRIKAVTLSGETIETLVVMGVDPKVFEVMDQGVRRTMGQVLSIKKEKNANATAAAVLCVSHFKRGGKLHNTSVYRAGTLQQAELLQVHPEIRDSVSWVRGFSRQIFPSPSVTIGLHFLFGCVDKKMRDEFFEGIAQASMPLEPRWDGPRSFQSQIVTNRKMFGLDPKLYACIAIKAWNYFHQGKGISYVRFRHEDEYPQIKGWEYDGEGIPTRTSSVVL